MLHYGLKVKRMAYTVDNVTKSESKRPHKYYKLFFACAVCDKIVHPYQDKRIVLHQQRCFEKLRRRGGGIVFFSPMAEFLYGVDDVVGNATEV